MKESDICSNDSCRDSHNTNLISTSRKMSNNILLDSTKQWDNYNN